MPGSGASPQRRRLGAGDLGVGGGGGAGDDVTAVDFGRAGGRLGERALELARLVVELLGALDGARAGRARRRGRGVVGGARRAAHEPRRRVFLVGGRLAADVR